MTRSARWAGQADAWAAWADKRREDDVLPVFYELLPRGTSKVLDVGCGEGRITRELRRRGYDTIGIDVAPRLVELARARDAGGEYLVAAAEHLPFDDASFDLVVAFNVLMSVDEPARAIDEAARVTRPGGCLCASLVHPIASSGEWEDDLFLVRDYLVERDHDQQVGELVFANVHLPLQGWFGLLEQAGFVVESLRELPRAGDRRWSRVPMFLLLRAVRR